MPSTQSLLKAYGDILIPNRIDEMTYQDAFERKLNTDSIDAVSIREALMRLWERDIALIKEERGS